MLEKTGSKPGVICCYYDVFYRRLPDIAMCVAEVGEGNSPVLSYLVNCYLRDYAENNELYIRESNVNSSKLKLN